MSLLIRDVTLDGKNVDIHCEDDRITEIGPVSAEADHVIDGSGMAAIPGLVNTHTHAAMTLFRSHGNDLPLLTWLSEKIWPVEAHLTADDIYWGTCLACLEMIRTGTTAFNDMYYHVGATARAVDDSGIRGVISAVFFNMLDTGDVDAAMKTMADQVDEIRSVGCDRVTPALGPHAPYTVSDEVLEAIGRLSAEEDLLVHFHLAETEKEVLDYRARTGEDLVPRLEKLGMLSPRMVAAHSVWVSPSDIDILARNGVAASHCPVSNMKLSIGGVLPYPGMMARGMAVTLGTDGCASNNNLDMFETVKFAALLQKHATNDPTAMPAHEAFRMATGAGAAALRIDAGGIAVGRKADILLIDLKRPEMTPGHDLVSDLVYSANGSCVDTTICDGKVLMLNRKVEGEAEVLEKAAEAARDLFSRE